MAEEGSIDGRFAGKVALVAGCARPPGMGYGTALRLARQGATVMCSDAVGLPPAGAAYDTGVVTQALLEQVTGEIRAIGPGRAELVAADPYDPTSWEQVVAATVSEFGRVDICCSLMGTTGPGSGDGHLMDVDLESWRRCYDVNVTSPLWLSRAAGRQMVAQGDGGAIVILSSYSAVVPPLGSGGVGSARAAINKIAEVLAAELAPHRVRVNTVLPLSVESGDDRFPNPGLHRLAAGEADSFSTWVHHQVPMGRPQSADEIAAAIEFLCSDDASFITGISLPVAGGAHSHS
jgi:NAD(P)-dependent dehydrogenase (short-subunit alcohol dehydrogenase family)